MALPWWGYVLAFGAALVCAWFAYARSAVRLTRAQRCLLTTLRALTLVLLVVMLLRPVVFVQATGARDSVVAVLVDGSRSMRIDDGGAPRIEQVRRLAPELLRQIGAEFHTELFTFGEALGRADVPQLAADARRSDLSGALAALADRYRGRRLAGVVVLSDGGDTAPQEAGSTRYLDVPVFTIGVGNPSPPNDRDVINLTAGEPLLSQSSVDLSATVTSTGFGTVPFSLHLTENGRPVETRRVVPPADGAPVHELFTVAPSPNAPTVYAIDVPIADGELVSENNARRILVPPQGRRRRILVVEGAPGFEHTFLKRALARDQSIEVDSVVRKGQNDQGRDTFFIQAASSRSASLAAGFPAKRGELFAYDAIIFGNIEGDFFSSDQLAMTAEFVALRGGGLLVLGARSFERAGLLGTPLEEVLPLDLTDRRATTEQPVGARPATANAATLTADGMSHPATRLAVNRDENRKRWSKLPPLASIAAVGSPRPGAQVLAVASGGREELRPLIVTQRYGLGRALVFAGEASWRWRMLMPASDTTHELVWRQMTRWLASGAGDAVEMPATSVVLPGTTESVPVLVRDEEFKPIANAEVVVRVSEPGGRERSVSAALAEPREGRYAASVRFEQAGVYRIAADVRRGGSTVTTVSRSLLVGGTDIEMSEPRLNEAVLRRIAETTGGRYLRLSDSTTLPGLLRESGVGQPPTEIRDLWHNRWSFALIVGLLAAEWIVRRRIGFA